MKLSTYYENIKTSLYPKDRRMKILDEKNVVGFSTENIRFIMNEICRLFCKELYVEVGSWKGCSLISSALYNKNAKFIGIDNFCEFNSSIEIVQENINKFDIENTSIIEGHYNDIIPIILKEKTIDVYFYDGNHDYNNQLNGLNIIKPYLKEECVIFVDDASWEDPAKANNDWLIENSDFKSIILTVDNYDVKKTVNNKFWWNGLQIIYRNVDIEY